MVVCASGAGMIVWFLKRWEQPRSVPKATFEFRPPCPARMPRGSLLVAIRKIPTWVYFRTRERLLARRVSRQFTDLYGPGVDINSSFELLKGTSLHPEHPNEYYMDSSTE